MSCFNTALARVACGADLAVVSVDIHGILQLDCLGLDWFARWLVPVAIVPICLLAAVGTCWLWRRRRAGTDGRARAAALKEGLSAAFFVVMLLYPRVSSKIFAVLRCRWLGPKTGVNRGPAVLEDDFHVDCMSEQYHRYETAASLLVVLIPIGVPLFALVVLLRAARKARDPVVRVDAAVESSGSVVGGGNGQEEAAEGQDDEEDRTLQILMEPGAAEDQHGHDASAISVHTALSQQYGFLVDDYRPGCYWYEPVDLLRKLALTSLLQVNRQSNSRLEGCNRLRCVMPHS